MQIHNKENQTFQEKVNEAVETVFKFLGLPTNTTFYNKLIIANPKGQLMELLKKQLDQPIHTFEIKDVIFIKNDHNLIYYRMRKMKGLKLFIRCEKTMDEKGVYSEKRRQISLREFLSVSKIYAPNRFVSKKVRSCFMFQNNYFQVDQFEVKGTTFSVCVIQAQKD